MQNKGYVAFETVIEAFTVYVATSKNRVQCALFAQDFDWSKSWYSKGSIYGQLLILFMTLGPNHGSDFKKHTVTRVILRERLLVCGQFGALLPFTDRSFRVLLLLVATHAILCGSTLQAPKRSYQFNWIFAKLRKQHQWYPLVNQHNHGK